MICRMEFAAQKRRHMGITPVHHRDLVITIDPALAQPVRPAQLFDGRLGATHAEPLDQDLGRFDMPGIVRRDLEHEFQFTGSEAGLGQERFGLVEILRPGLQVLVVGRRRGEAWRGCYLALTPERALNQRFLVDHVIQGLAHLRIIEGRFVVVHVQERPAEREPGHDLKIVIALESVDAIKRDIVDQVEFACLKAGQPNRRFRHLTRQDAIEMGSAVPIIVEADEFHLVAEFASNELERPATHRLGALHVTGTFRHDDAGAIFRQARQERCVDLLHAHDDGVVVRRVDGIDIVEHFEIDRTGIRVAAAVEGVFHVRRGHVRPVVELHALAQVERIGQPVIGHLIAFGEAWNDLKILVHRDDGVVHILQQPAGGGGSGLMHVKVLRRLGVTPDQSSAGLRFSGCRARKSCEIGAKCGGAGNHARRF